VAEWPLTYLTTATELFSHSTFVIERQGVFGYNPVAIENPWGDYESGTGSHFDFNAFSFSS
jgi:hypothetical protein